jgi:hypothetical protein
MNKRQARNLFKAVQALRESPAPKDFRMSTFVNMCGTPACVLGHLGLRRDLQRKFKFVRREMTGAELEDNLALYRESPEDWSEYKPDAQGRLFDFRMTYNDGELVDYEDRAIQDFFGLNPDEMFGLFDGEGCGGAQKPKEAIRYIERFIVTKVRDQLKAAGMRPSVKAARAWAGAA